MSDDGYIDHQKLAGPQYLLWHDSKYGFRFGTDKWHTLHQAERDAQLFRSDGLETNIVKVEMVNGEPCSYVRAAWLMTMVTGRCLHC